MVGSVVGVASGALGHALTRRAVHGYAVPAACGRPSESLHWLWREADGPRAEEQPWASMSTSISRRAAPRPRGRHRAPSNRPERPGPTSVPRFSTPSRRKIGRATVTTPDTKAIIVCIIYQEKKNIN